MAKYKIREVVEREVELDPGEVLSIATAAQWLGISIQAVAQALDRGKLTTVISETSKKRQGRRLVLRKEVEAWAAERGKDARRQGCGSRKVDDVDHPDRKANSDDRR